MNGDGKNLSGEELQAAVSSILSDPGFGKMLAQLRGTPTDEPIPTPTVTPEMMEKLPAMMQALAPMFAAQSGGEKPDGGEMQEKREAPEKPEKSTPPGPDAACRKKLLSALRPYLNDHRRDALDNILRVTEMTDLIGTLGKKPKP